MGGRGAAGGANRGGATQQHQSHLMADVSAPLYGYGFGQWFGVDGQPYYGPDWGIVSLSCVVLTVVLCCTLSVSYICDVVLW